MILIAGIESEGPVRLVREAAERAGIDYRILNQRKSHLYDISVACVENKWSLFLNIDNVDYCIEDFAGIYVRMMDYSFLPEIKDKVYNYVGDRYAHKAFLFHHQFIEMLEIAACRIMNRASDMLSNMSKPFQLQLIAKVGLKVPPTCITNSQADVNEFQDSNKQLIFKSASWIRSIVTQLNGIHQSNFRNLKYLPTQFQKKLIGDNVRVHIAGDALFATKVCSESVDYRYAAQEGNSALLEPLEIPVDIAKRCFELSRQLNLPLCGIDLFLTSEGDYYCFEVNPSPGFSYYQESTGQDIALAIVNFLEFGDNQNQ